MKTKKMNKMKNTDFSHKPGKLAFNLKMNIMKMGESARIWNIYDNFHFSVQILAKIIINFSDLSIFPICVVFIFQVGC